MTPENSRRESFFAGLLCRMGPHNKDPLISATTRYDPLRPAKTRYDPLRPAKTRCGSIRFSTVPYGSVLTVRFSRLGLTVRFLRFGHGSSRFCSHGSVLTVRFSRFGSHGSVLLLHAPVQCPAQFRTLRFARFGSHGSK